MSFASTVLSSLSSRKVARQILLSLHLDLYRRTDEPPAESKFVGVTRFESERSEINLSASIESSEKPSVLLVESDPVMRSLIGDALEGEGFAVLEATDGETALESIEAAFPDIVIVEAFMPGLDGFKVCSKIREMSGGEHVPIVLTSELEDHASVSHAFDVGATDYLTKPLNPTILTRRLRHLWRSSQGVRRLAKSEADLEMAQRLACLGMWTWSLDSGRWTGSDEAYRILGIGARDGGITFQKFANCVHPADHDFLVEGVEAALKDKDKRLFKFEHRLLTSGGEERCVRTQGKVDFDGNGRATRVKGTIQEITDLVSAKKKIHFLAHFDDLTGLANRLLFKKRLEESLANARRAGLNVAVILLDLDRFKRINDTLGHSTGDDLLKEVAERLDGLIRSDDSIAQLAPDRRNSSANLARLGGDEFTIVLSRLRYAQDAARVASRILKALSEPFFLNDQEIVVTGSIGIAIRPHDGDEVDVLLRHADTAMYHAKSEGKNNYQFFSPDMNSQAFERLALENRLRKALENRELCVYYQPQISLDGDKPVGAEALVRWIHPEMGVLAPGQFMVIAEEAGILSSIDKWIINEACGQLKSWREQGMGIERVAVNVSNALFKDPSLGEVVAAALSEHQLPPRCLELELTEGVVMADAESALGTLRQLKAQGIQLAIDDFGTGYSSLSYLRHCPIDTLKIDRSFVVDLQKSQSAEALVRAIIAMGQSLELKVLAEGVETKEQLDFVRRYGCEEVQGYFWSKPVPAAEFVDFVRDGAVAYA